MADWLLGAAEERTADEGPSLASRQQAIKDLFSRANESDDEDGASSKDSGVRSHSRKKLKRKTLSRSRSSRAKGSRRDSHSKDQKKGSPNGRRRESAGSKSSGQRGRSSERKSVKDEKAKDRNSKAKSQSRDRKGGRKSEKDVMSKSKQTGAPMHPMMMAPPWAAWYMLSGGKGGRPHAPGGKGDVIDLEAGTGQKMTKLPCPHYGTPFGCQNGKNCVFVHSAEIAGRNAQMAAMAMSAGPRNQEQWSEPAPRGIDKSEL